VTTTAEVIEFTGKLAELVRRVQSGNEVVLTQGHKPVAKLVAASGNEIVPGTTFQIHSLKGHRVLTPVISQSELADEMFMPSA
jgi:antitoxin (DNA-binding transcriptional repressor) of toxin-antitoxin stability system